MLSKYSNSLRKKWDIKTILLITIIVVFVMFAVSYSLVTPAFEGTDETAHYAASIHMYDNSYEPGRIYYNQGHPLYYTIMAGIIGITHPDADFYEGYLQRNRDWNHDPALFHHGIEGQFPFEGMYEINHTLRWVSIIFGVITLIFVYKIGVLVFKDNKWLPLYLTAIVSTIPVFVWLNSLMSSDPLLWMFSTITIYFLLKFVTTWQNKFIALTAIFAFLAFSTKILATPLYLIIAVGLVYFFVSKRPKIKEIVKSGVLFSAITLVCFAILFSYPSFTASIEAITANDGIESDIQNEEISDSGEVEIHGLLSGFIEKTERTPTLERVTDPHHIHTRLVKFSISGLLGHGTSWAFENLPVDVFFWASIGKGLKDIWRPGILYHIADVFLLLAGIGIMLLIKNKNRIDVSLNRYYFVIITSAVIFVIGGVFYNWLFTQVGVARYTFLIVVCYGIILSLGWYSIFNSPKRKVFLFAPLIFLALMSVQNMVSVQEIYAYEMRDFAGDGIMDDIDTTPGLFSNDFRYVFGDYETTGTILNRIEDIRDSQYNRYWGLYLVYPIDDLNDNRIDLKDAVKIIIKNESPNFDQLLSKIPERLKNEKLKIQVNDIIKELEADGKIVNENGVLKIPIQSFKITKDNQGIKIMNEGAHMQSVLLVELCDNVRKKIPSKTGIIFSCDSRGLDTFQQINYEPILPHGIKNGDIIQSEEGIKAYLIDNGVKRHITEGSKTELEFLFGNAFPIKRNIVKTSTFDELGFTIDMVKFVSDETVNSIPTGKMILSPSHLDWGWYKLDNTTNNMHTKGKN